MIYLKHEGEINLKLREALQEMLEKRNEVSVDNFIKCMINLFPPSDDLSISILKRGNYEYVLDRKGLCLVSLAQDEYLPFFSASEKRLTTIPHDIVNYIANNWKIILKELEQILDQYSKRESKYKENLEEVKNLVNN
jgi:hypothetical protein